MKKDDHLYGFVVTDVRPSEDTDGTLYALRHEKTGAKLLWMQNDQPNKLFSITFRTIPWDDTGVFHILEHSVLCGSERYPVKEPFLELLKSSMNTFLNALTFPDKTMYPVSSRNAADFMNLVRVYLDAVFHPAIYDDPCVFQQEGWHIEQREPGGERTYKGVVYNEMIGALSGVHRRMAREMDRLLYPDSPYRFLSGGDPAAIPDLSYEDFLRAHLTFYHPSNAYIYLDGDLDIGAVLALLSEELDRHEPLEVDSALELQRPIAPCRATFPYPLGQESPSEMQTYAALGKILGTWEEREKLMALEVLASALADTNESPLSRALLDTGLCRDVTLMVDSGALQASGYLAFSNTETEHVDALVAKTREVAEKLCREGIDRQDLAAAIDRMEFQARDVEEPVALIRNLNVLSSWLYGGDPLLYLHLDEAFAFLRAKLDTGYYEELLRSWLLEEEGTALVVAVPDRDLERRQELDTRARLDRQAQGLREEELLRQNERLALWQQTPDSPEHLATIPRLPLSEVSREPIRVETQEETLQGVRLLRHPSRQKGVVSLQLYFDCADLSPEQITELALLADLLGELPTKKRSGAELQRRVKALFGSLSQTVSSFAVRQRPGAARPTFTVQAKFLSRHLPEALDLLFEILAQTDFDCGDKLLEQMKQMDEGGKQSIITGGHSYALMRAMAPLSANGTLRELRGGFTAWKHIHALAADPENSIPGLIGRLEALAGLVLARARLTASVTAHEDADITPLLAARPQGTPCACDAFRHILKLPAAQAIQIPAQTAYSASGAQLGAHGAWNVAASILSLEYLWTEVRVKGGAYGAGCSAANTGEVLYYSYRDPTPARSLECDRGAADFLREYAREAPGLESYIISTIAKAQPLASDAALGALADNWILRGVSWEARCEEYRRILETSREDLAAITETLRAPLNWCIVGPRKAIEAARAEDLLIESL